MIEEKKTEYLFWDEMWNEPIKEVKKNEETTTKNQLENNKNKP